MGIFRQEMKTKRGLQNVLVTPFGLTKSKHNGIINNVVTAEGLFRAEECESNDLYFPWGRLRL